MEFRPIDRGPEAFQKSVTADEIQAICRRVFGPRTHVHSAVELGAGMYNTAYRVAVAGRERPVVLRIAPAPDRQSRSESRLMRNEYASIPWLTALTPLIPRVIAADWSHEVLGRDYLVQTLLDGLPAASRLGDYPRSAWPGFFRRLGTIARTVHAVRGPHFGPVLGPAHATWGQAVTAWLTDIAADLDRAGLESADVRKVAAVAAQRHEVLDAVTEPRMLTDDLWTPNVLLDTASLEPRITGVVGLARTWWGDPAADRTVRMALARTDGREAFWEGYGEPDRSAEAVWRSRVYEARHLGAIRLERHRLGDTGGVRDTYDTMAAVLAELA